MNAARGLRFAKMHGAGNDFVMLDRRGDESPIDPALAIRLADRHTGVGCDQVITIESPRGSEAVAYYGIWNADGSSSRQCGNGARCVAAWLIRDGLAEASFVLESPSGPVLAQRRDDGGIAINMGVPDFSAAAIGLDVEDEADPYEWKIEGAPVQFGAVSIGNPHAVIAVDDTAQAPVAHLGAALQNDPTFRDSCNVGFAQVLARDRIRLRVFERGAGETLACGSGACAAVAVLARRGLLDRDVAVELPGGTLRISWDGPGHAIWLAGPTAFVFEGEFNA